MPILKYDADDPEVRALQRIIQESGMSLNKLSLAMGRTAAFWSRKLGAANKQRRAVTAKDIAAAKAVLRKHRKSAEFK